jgi:prepilin-type N-terminal cleavage/methylation domain-containing protein
MRLTLARSNTGPHSPHRSGYTLLELMLVLAVLTVIVSLTWPSLRKPLHRSAVQEAASQLVKDLGQARLAAIESGQSIRFRYEPGGGRYLLDSPSGAENDEESAGEDDVNGFASDESGGAGSGSFVTDNKLSSGPSSGSSGGRQREARPAWILRGELPTEVVFRDPAEVTDEELPPGSALSDMLADEASEREEVTTLIEDEDENSDLSVPVYFYANGRAENAEVVLVGPEEYRIAVRLRGLTGAASLGPLEHPVRDYSDRERANQEDANRQNSDREEPTQESPRNSDSNSNSNINSNRGSNRNANSGSSERTPASAPRGERSTPRDPPRVTRERD